MFNSVKPVIVSTLSPVELVSDNAVCLFYSVL